MNQRLNSSALEVESWGILANDIRDAPPVKLLSGGGTIIMRTILREDREEYFDPDQSVGCLLLIELSHYPQHHPIPSHFAGPSAYSVILPHYT